MNTWHTTLAGNPRATGGSKRRMGLTNTNGTVSHPSAACVPARRHTGATPGATPPGGATDSVAYTYHEPRGERAGGAAGVLIWDLPVRVFHWLLVLAFTASFLTRGADRFLDLHVFAGYVTLSLVVFRIYWLMRGGYYARLARLRFAAAEVAQYLGRLVRHRAQRFPGHNPAGAWAVVAMLALLGLVCASGIAVMGSDEGHGPLAGMLGHDLDTLAKAVHRALSWLMVGLVGVHLTGVLVESRLHRENLIAAMLSGRKRIAEQRVPASAAHARTAIILAGVVGVAVIWYATGAFLFPGAAGFRPFIGTQLAQDPTWQEECADCHLAYHPSLLPARSWNRLLRGQSDHFGEDLGLDEDTLAALWRFAAANSADKRLTEPARKIESSLSAGRTLLRVTRTPYWKRKHAGISKRVWERADISGRGNCAACHRDAQSGTFEDGYMHIPEAPRRVGT